MPARRAFRITVPCLHVFFTALLGLCSMAAASAQAPQVLQHHVRPEISAHTAALVDVVPDSQPIQSSIVLPLRNADALKALITRLYDPSSPDYHHFLSVDQFTEQFGPTADDFNAVVAFARANGLAVSSLPTNRMVVPFSGTTAQVNAAFHVRMSVYQHPTEQRTFISPDREPSIDLAVPVSHISGLDSFSVPRASLVRGPSSSVRSMAVNGSGPGGAYLGSDMRSAYYGGTTLTGNGQAIGILEFGGYARSDVDLTFSNAGQSYNVPINDVLLDGATTGSGVGDGEQVLDIVQAIGMAPGLSQVRVYIGRATGGLDDANILNTMASENIAKQLSCSWSWRPADPSTDDPFFQEMAAQGQSFFVASGDNGAFDSAVDPFFFPQEDQNITAVGGTHLTTSAAGGAWAAETTWNSDGRGTGGGISPDGISLPSWQSGLANSANGGSSTLRNIPDVAMEGDFDNYACENGVCEGDWAGTSFAAPRWAAFMALVNQQAMEAGNAPTGGIGYLNPALYRIAQASASSADFHDVTSGNNQTANQPQWFSATPGYDLTTGWGSANGQALIDDLAGPQVPGFWIAAGKASLGIAPGGTTTSAITISPAGGFTGDVTLAVTGLPSDVTASFSPNPATGSSVLTLTASSGAVQSLKSITVTGTSGTLTASTTFSLAVHTPTFTLAAAPSSLGISQGSSGSTSIAVTSLYGFTGSVNLSISGLPTGVTAAFSPASTTGNSTLTLNVGSTATPGNSTLTITGTSGSVTSSVSLQLTIHGPSFTLSGPSSVSIGVGASGTGYLYVYDLYGFNGNVNLAASGLPAGVTATFTPNPTTSSATVTFAASSAAATGSSAITITGASGALTASTTLTLGVYAPTFTLSNGGSVSIGQGHSGNGYVYISPQYGFNGNVTLSVSGLPSGVTALLTPNPTTSSSNIVFSANSTVPAGQYPLTITGTSGAQTASTSLTLGVYAPTFTLSSYYNISIGQGTSASAYISVNPQYGFTGSVTLAASNLPSGVTATISPNPSTGSSNITLNASSTATLGQYNITITGTSGTQTASTTLTVGVYAPTFTLSNYGGISVGRGTSTTGYVYVTSQYGFTGSVNLAASGLPAGVTAAFSPNPTTGNANLTLTASSAAALGQYNITVTGTSGTQTVTSIVPVTIYNPTFSLSAPSALSLGQGTSSTSYVYVTQQYGFTGSVALSASGLPSGVTASFSPNPTTNNATLTLTATGTTAPGQYNVTITGTSGPVTQTSNFILTVGAPTFTVSAGSVTVGQGGTNSTYISLYGQFGFNSLATLSVSGLPAGVTASFSPNTTTSYSTLIVNASSTAAVGATTITITATAGAITASTTTILTIAQPTFSLSSGISTLQLNQQSSNNGYLYINGQNGFSGAVTLSATGLPSGASMAFATNPTTSYSNLFTVSSGNAAPGSYAVTVTGTSGAASSSFSFILLIETPSFTLTAAPASIVLHAGESQKSTISLTPVFGFSGGVTYAVAGLPPGVTATISPNPSASQTVITFSAAADAAPSTTVATVTGTAGATSAAVPIRLNLIHPAQATATALTIVSRGQSTSTSSAGQPVTLTATVTAGSTPITTGQILFCDASGKSCDPTHLVATAQLTSNGTATFTFLPSPGSNTYKAVFNGNATNVTSTSTSSTLTVNSALASHTTMNISGSTGDYTVAATVTGTGTIPPSGSLSIFDTTEGNRSLGSATLTPGTAQITATAQPSITFSGYVSATATGDFNGDGILDLVATNSSSNTLSVFLGKGDGSFQDPTPLGLSSAASAIFLSDFNGDGHLDIAAAQSYSTMAIFLGNGDGTFIPAQGSSSIGASATVMVGDDFNHDGIEDLAVANNNASSLTILLGSGDGNFTASTQALPFFSYSKQLLSGDFNGDGYPDLVVGNSTSSGLLLLLGNGDGTFTAAPVVTTPFPTVNIGIGDLNGDGKLDLAFAGASTNLGILLGNGDGTFTLSQTASVGNYSQIGGAVISDANHDGKPDLIASNIYSPGFYVFLGNGDGTFAVPTTFPSSQNLFISAAADLNGDGMPELLSIINNNTTTLGITSLLLTQTATATATGISPSGTGQHAVTASFPGDTIFAASTSAPENLTTSTATPVVTVRPAATTLDTTQPLAVQVLVAGGPADPTATGSVQLTSGSYTATANLANGAATLTIPAGTLPLGANTLNLAYTPNAASASVFHAATGSASVTVTSGTPNLTWTTPAAITYGAALGATQLNASTSITGTLTYTPALGTVLPAGAQKLSVSFTPTDPTKFAPSTTSVTLIVNKAPLTLTAANLSRPFGSANPTLTGTINGAVNGDALTESLTTAATSDSPTGTYAIVPSAAGAALANYTLTPVNGVLTVAAAGTATTLQLSNNNLTFTATVTSAATGTPSGQVTFYSGTTTLGSATLNAGTATYTAAAFPTGNATLTANYTGGGNYSGSTSTAQPVLAVTPANTALTVSSASSVQDALSFSVVPGYVGTLQLACSGLPQTATCSLSPASISFTGAASTASATITIHTGGTSSLAPFASPFGGNRILFAALSLPGILGLAFATRRRRLRSLLGTLMALAILAIAPVAFIGCGGSGGGGTSSGGSGGGTTTTTTTTAAGSYTVQVTATGGSLAQTTTINLTVQ